MKNIYSDFLENPTESILVYVSYSGLGTPNRILGSHSIVSVKVFAQDSGDSKLEDVTESYRHFCYQIRDLVFIDVKTMDKRDIKIRFEEENKEGDVWSMKTLSSPCSDHEEVRFDLQTLVPCVHPKLHVLITDQVKIPSLPVNKVFDFSVVAPDSVGGIRMEILEHVGEIKWSSVVRDKFIRPQVVQDMISSTLKGLHNGKRPLGGEGVCYMQDVSGEKMVSVFRSMRPHHPFVLPGERASREVAAYLLDHPRSGHRTKRPGKVGLAGVPVAAMIRYWPDQTERWILGSLQMYVADACMDKDVSCFPADEVHKIAVLDIRLANCNRNRDDILAVEEEGKIRLTPINHGLCFPCNLDQLEWVWRDWPQAQEPFSSDIVGYVEKLDAEKDIAFLESYGWRIEPETARLLKVCTMLLKEAVKRNLTAFDVGSIMTRRDTPKEKTVLGKMLDEAEQPTDSEDGFFKRLSKAMESHLDDSIDWLRLGED